MSVRVVDESDFEEIVLTSPVPVLVDFFTVWCGPCKALAPTLADLSEEYGERVRIVSVDAEQSPGLKDAYGVTGYPTMVLLKDGAEVSRPTVRSRMQLREVLDEALGLVPAPLPEAAPLDVPPAVADLLGRLLSLDDKAWAQIDAAVLEAARHPVDEAPAEPVDEEAVIAAVTRVDDDVQELASARLGPGPLATGIGSAAAASFDRWVRQSPVRSGWLGAMRCVPAARMSPYLPAGDVPDDPAVAGARFLESLAALDKASWDDIRLANQDFFPWVEHARRVGVNAWLAAVILIQSTVSPDFVPTSVHEDCWAPFADVLSREAVA